MRNFDPELLETDGGGLIGTTAFKATLNAHGLYDGLRFVVRLSPRVHQLISELPNGIGFASGIRLELVQAFSTYLHETIHWWQHIGSTTGFMLSVSYPAQTHANLNHLRSFLKQVGPKKPIRAYAVSGEGPSHPDTPLGLANTIVNNQFDIEAFRLLATNPERVELLVNNPLFECVAHCYEIAIAQTLFSFASTFDPDFALLPDPRKWEAEIERLRNAREPGYYYGSPITLSPIGAYYLFEGQARFVQLQYLHFASGGLFDWSEAEGAGMLAPPYIRAFEAFLAKTGLERPASIDHPIVGLFLLVCDLAINPGEGFPLPIWSWKTFLNDVDPGVRFLYLCVAIRHFRPDVAAVIRRYDADEYRAVSEALCDVLKTYTPLQIAGTVEHWVQAGAAFRRCLALHDQGRAAHLNMPLQLLFGQFASFMRDKLAHPHILCWPGAAMAGPRAQEETVGVFSRQSPLFIDRADDDTIVPILRPGLRQDAVMETFNAFYSAHSLYDLTRQWITSAGPFRYDYTWLQPNGTFEDVKAWADDGFARAYGILPDDFDLLP